MWLKERRKDSKEKHKSRKSLSCIKQKYLIRGIYRCPLKVYSGVTSYYGVFNVC